MCVASYGVSVMQGETRQQLSVKQDRKENRLKFRYKRCHSLPLSFPSISHVLPTNRSILCLESCAILDSGQNSQNFCVEKRAYLKKPEFIVVLNNPNILRRFFLKILKYQTCQQDTHLFSFPSTKRLEDKYASTTPPLYLKIYELELVVKKHKDLKTT